MRKKHYNTGNRNGRFKHGKTMLIHYCVDCKTEISDYRRSRCPSCATKQRHLLGIFNSQGDNNPFAGKKHTMKSKIKQSLSHGGIGIPYENSDYPAEFNEPLRESIRKRDKNKCVCCGMTKKEHFKKYDRNLEVHHKDRNKQNNKKSNLETRCKKCNIKDVYDK